MAETKRLRNGYVVGSRFVERGSVDPKELFGKSATYPKQISVTKKRKNGR